MNPSLYRQLIGTVIIGVWCYAMYQDSRLITYDVPALAHIVAGSVAGTLFGFDMFKRGVST